MAKLKSFLKKVLNILNVSIVRFYQNIPIRYKLLLVLNILMIITLLGISYINFKNSEVSLTKKSTQYTQDILKLIEIRLNDYVHNLDLISQDLSLDERIRANADLGLEPTDSLESYAEVSSLENLFRKVIFTRNEIQSIALITNKGECYPADMNNRVVSIKQLVPYKSELYNTIIKSAREMKGLPVFVLDMEEGRAKNLFMARVVYDINSFDEIGLMLFLLKTDYLNTIIKDLVNEDTQNIIILTGSHDVIAERNNHASEEKMMLELDRIQGTKGWFLDDSQKNIISYIAMDKNPKWKIVSFVSLDSLYRDIDGLKEKIMISSIIIVLFMSMVSLLMTADFVRPFRKLIRGMERVQKGDKEVTIELNRKDEIGYLGEAFNRMVKEMNTLSTWVYQEQLTRKEAELKALQSQINPHFLFNTLESINWMAQLNNFPEISDMVTALSSLMEASIGKGDKLITIKEELKYIDNYYLIMKKRFADRIDLIKNVDDAALDVKIPRLLIQPLVENAVHHGIDNSMGRGCITVTATLSGAMLIIVVEDDGEGIDPDDLQIINENLAVDNETYFQRISTKKARSIGLENVNRRIKLFYGEKYGLSIESKKMSYTRVIVTVPLDCPESLLQGRNA
jgi:two-component system sensor histidine kinase YesM